MQIEDILRISNFNRSQFVTNEVATGIHFHFVIMMDISQFESGHCSRILQRSESRNIVCEKCLGVGRGAIEFL